MESLRETVIPADELTEADLDTVVHALQHLRQKIEAEPLDPLFDHREAYNARRHRSEAVYAVVLKVRRLRDELRRL